MKARRVDYYAADLIAGCATVLSAEELGVYWLVCSLIYDRGEPIDNDAPEIARKFRGTSWRTVRACIDRLLTLPGKLVLTGDGKLSSKRCHDELMRSLKRVSSAIANGQHGGRPPKENNDLPKAPGSSGEKLSDIEQQASHSKQRGAKAPGSEPDGFAEWYGVYPMKRDRKDAARAYAKAVKETTPDILLTAARRYAAFVAEKYPDAKERERYTRYPATWLNKGSWANADDAPRQTAQVVAINASQLREQVAARPKPPTAEELAERERIATAARQNFSGAA